MSDAVKTYFRHCHRQPLWLFNSEADLLENGSDEVVPVILALALCCDPNPRSCDAALSPEGCADTARSSIMMAIANGRVTFGTMQTLCLLAYYNYTGKKT